MSSGKIIFSPRNPLSNLVEVRKLIYLFSCFFLLLFSSCREKSYIRNEIILNGTWEITKTDTSSGIPNEFISNIPVPGLVDMADPPIEKLPSFSGKKMELAVQQTDSFSGQNIINYDTIPPDESWYYNDAVYWYRKVFILEDKPGDIAILKINKSKYHGRIFINGILAGENQLNFTPAYVNIKPWLKKPGEPNEIIIATGCRNNLSNKVIRGDDFEKFFFIPGIYDDVKIILSDLPFIQNVQIAPDIENSEIRVVAEVINGPDGSPFTLTYKVMEKNSHKEMASGRKKDIAPDDKSVTSFDFRIPVKDARLWSPEDPFLYELELSTDKDQLTTSFGMREFKALKNKNQVALNGKPYYLRGTNVSTYRFFEDSERGSLPWDREWVAGLYEFFKDMHWNSFRTSLGPPPDFWYDIADSMGLLIQDEYPIWKGHVPKSDRVTSTALAHEYEHWMRERWNHPSVVIWDGQNESVYDTTALAINKVRHLDLSNRPWDNGWAPPAGEEDVMEAHRYFFYPFYAAYKNEREITFKNGLLHDFFSEPIGPRGPYDRHRMADEPFPNPAIMNEYTWMWLNRDGTPTAVSELIYENLFPEANTPEKRFEEFARMLGMETEFWRAHRKFAGVMTFAALSYSRPELPKGITSDNFKDVKNLIPEPYFYKYVRPAFNPVGVMLDFWDQRLTAERVTKIEVNLINDTYVDWKGEVILSLVNENTIAFKKSVHAEVSALGREVSTIDIQVPNHPGNYEMIAEIEYENEKVKSVRRIKITY
jgi:hypothetical protein